MFDNPDDHIIRVGLAPRYRVRPADGRVYWEDRAGSFHPLRQWNDPDGYPSVQVYIDGRPKSVRVHRLVLEALEGPRQPGQVSRHLDGDRTRNEAGNLARGTFADNARDARRHRELAKAVREAYQAGASVEWLAAQYDARPSHITDILEGRRWPDRKGRDRGNPGPDRS